MKTALKSAVNTSITPPQSLVLMKNMLRLSVSNICYLRDVFPAECFSVRDYAGLKVHQIECADKSADGETIVRNEDAFLLTQWLEKGVFEALANSYLKTMTFAIYTKSPGGADVLVETYSFAFEYPEGAPLKLNGQNMDRDSMKRQAVSFIRCLVEFTGTLDELPEDRWLTLKLTYYDDITPTDYEPKYFAAARSDVLQFERNVLRVKIGKIETPSHTLNLKFAGVDTSDPNIQLPEETVSLEEMTDYGKQKSTNGTYNSGFGQSLVHHSPGTGDAASASIATSTTVVKKAKDLAEFSDLNIRDNLAKKRHTEWPSDEEPTQVDSECNISMVERVKSYILSERSITKKKCMSRFQTETWVVDEAFKELREEGKLIEKNISTFDSAQLNREEEDKENMKNTLLHNNGRKRATKSLKRQADATTFVKDNEAATRRSKRIRSHNVYIDESNDTAVSSDDGEALSEVIEVPLSQGSVFTPHPGDKCSVIRDPLHPLRA